MPKISDEDLKTYFEAGGYDPEQVYANMTYQGSVVAVPAQMQSANLHPLYSETIMQYYPLRVHADGIFPAGMIAQRRPSETEEILAYRQQTYKPITKLPVSKVIASLSKIRRSPDWSISFKQDKVPAKIVDVETLEQYCSFNLPGYQSITNWAFAILLKQQAIDANAVVAVLPIEAPVENEYIKPVPIVFNSDHVLEYNEEMQMAILKSRKKINGRNRFYYIDDLEFIVYDETKDGFAPSFQQPHILGHMPVFKVSGEVFRQYENIVLNRSRLDAMIPFLDEAACEYSDLKGSKIQHLFPLFWYYQNKDCIACKGAGSIPSPTGNKQCLVCGGDGKIKFSPFAHIQVDPPGLGQTSIPNPPAGYITRDVAILDLQEKSVEKNIFKSLSAINMQFLDQTPLNISGDAKNVDREELNNFVYNFAEDLVASIDKAVYWINEWRYSYIVPDKEQREGMLPDIAVPQNFDLLPSDYLIDEITKARTNKVNPFLLATLEQQLAAKKFYNDPELAATITLFFELDPLPGLTVDEKMSLISSEGITKKDFVISSYIAQFIKRAVTDDPEFGIKTYDEQMALLSKYADEKIIVNDAAAQMIQKQKLSVAMAGSQINNPLNNQADPAANAA